MTELTRELDVLVPDFDNSGADWEDALRRSRRRPAWPLALAAAAVLAGVMAAASFAHMLDGGALERLSAWVTGAPGAPASEEERRALAEANARSAAPLPEETELGLLARKTINGVEFQLFGFRDRSSLCLRLRSSSGEESGIVKAPASCVSEELLVNLGKPLAVVAAADPFPQTAKRGLQALYGLAADGAAFIELEGEGGRRRVAVDHNAFLFLYEGESPRHNESTSRLDYQSDVPWRASAFDAAGRALGSVRIMSLKRGYPAGPPAHQLPGPDRVERPAPSPRVGWLDRGEERGGPYQMSLLPLRHARIIHPNPATSLRVVVALGNTPTPSYCLIAIWPLQEGPPRGFGCHPVTSTSGTLSETRGAVSIAIASPMFDSQFPVHYGLAPDGIASLKLVLANGATTTVPLKDNVFAFQTASPESAKLVGYDAEGRVALMRVIPPTP